MRFAGILLTAIGAASAPAGAQTMNDEFSKNVVATFDADEWHAASASFEGYGYSPRRGCRMSTDGATLTQWRVRESGHMAADWSLLEEVRRKRNNLNVEWIKVDSVRYEATFLPWRLAGVPPNGIVLTYDLTFLAVRRDSSEEWLPATYLTLPLQTARRMEVGYSFETDDRKVVHGNRSISLQGFSEVAKWCGRELLRDRQDQARVKDLTK